MRSAKCAKSYYKLIHNTTAVSDKVAVRRKCIQRKFVVSPDLGILVVHDLCQGYIRVPEPC
eukprot:1372421-Amphidinium_carterae.1